MISICMAYFNRKPQLLKTLNSINESSVKDYEIIIVDDGSDESHILDLNELKAHCNGNVTLIEIDPTKKTWHNSCIAYNIAFSASSGNTIIIQNPETYYMGDILYHVNKNLLPTTYLTYQTIAVNKDVSHDIYAKKNIIEVSVYMEPIIKNTRAVGASCPYYGTTIWYNHKQYRPVYYHFISAITKDNLNKLGGFDERYKDDHSYDDNEILTRIDRLGLKKQIISSPMAIHLYHPMFYTTSPFSGGKNRNLYSNNTLKESHILAQELNFNNYTQYLK